MKAMKRKLSEFLLRGVKDIVDLSSYVRKKWLTDLFPNNPPSLVSKRNFAFSNTQYFNHENMLTFHFDSDISLIQKEELYFETSFMYHYLCNKGYFLCLHKTMFSNDNHENKNLFGSMQGFVENTSEEQLSWKINSTLDELKNFSGDLSNKNALINPTENELFLNISENIYHSSFDSNLNSTLLPYISAGNSVFPTTEQDILLNENSTCHSVCSSKSQILFENWKYLKDMEFRLYFCNEHFNMPLESQKVVNSSKKMQILTKEYLKFLFKAFIINTEFLKCNIKDYQSAMEATNFPKLVKEVLKNNLILKFPISLCLEVVFDSGDANFTEANRLYVLFEGQRGLRTVVANSFNFLTLDKQIEPWSNFGTRMLSEEFGVNKICSSKVKRLYFGKNFEINQLFQGHLQSSRYKEAVKTNLVDHTPNMPGLTKISLPIVQNISKEKVICVNANHPVGLNDMHLLTHIQYGTSYESKNESKNIFEKFRNYNITQVNKDDPVKVLTTVPSMTLEPEIKCETQIYGNDCQRRKIYQKEMRIIQAENYFGNKDVTKSYQHYFDNRRCSMDKVISNTQHFPMNSILTKDVNADDKLENSTRNQKNNSSINILDATKNENNFVLNKDIESIKHINHGYKEIDFAQSNSSHDGFTLLENLCCETESLCNTPRNLATDRDSMKNESHSDLNKNIESKSTEHINHGYKEIDFAQSNSSHDGFTLLENLSFETENLCNTPRELVTGTENFYSRRCKRKREDMAEYPNKKVQTESCQTTEINTLSVEGGKLNMKKCSVLLKKVEPSQYKALIAIENTSDSLKNHKDKTSKPFKGTESKFDENLSERYSGELQAMNETNNLRYNLRNSKDKNFKPSTGKKRKYQQNTSNNSVGLIGTVLSTTPKDSGLYFTSENDERNLSTKFDAFDMESNFSGHELSSISKRFRPTRNKREVSETENKIRNNFELKNTEKRERKQTLKNLCTPKIKAENLSNPEAKRRRGTKSVNLRFSVETANQEGKCDKLSNENNNPKSNSFIITSSLNTIYSSDGKSCIKYNKSIQAKFETPQSSQLQCYAKSFKRKREKSKSATLPKTDGSINDIISDFRLPVDEIVTVAKRIKRDKMILRSEDSKSKSSRNSLPKCGQVLPIDKGVIPLPKEKEGCRYVYNSGTIQVATIDDLCLKSRRKEFLKSKTRSRHRTA